MDDLAGAMHSQSLPLRVLEVLSAVAYNDTDHDAPALLPTAELAVELCADPTDAAAALLWCAGLLLAAWNELEIDPAAYLQLLALRVAA